MDTEGEEQIEGDWDAQSSKTPGASLSEDAPWPNWARSGLEETNVPEQTSEKARKTVKQRGKSYTNWTRLTNRNKSSLPPFLTDCCEKDVAFLNLMVLHHPFSADFGTKTQVWLEFTGSLSTARGKNGKLLFSEPLTIDMCQKRWLNILKYFKSYDTSSPFRSGTDDEPSNDVTSLLSSCLDIYRGYEGEQKKVKSKRKLEKTRRAEESDISEKMREAYIGERSREDIKELSRKGKSGSKNSGEGTSTDSSLTDSDPWNKKITTKTMVRSFFDLDKQFGTVIEEKKRKR
eukprot:CAMPEP_0202441874 /NCGR_PEP_ID=MMETSP1360-20130828/1386_1 /ASSEMBLY_ACC=CAM_ASM_000848 /TAXON_ID=515479 /ORGANISM="Licmophora paradoxa, Strain CCMP2313" /LENGTH=288 /DNA_ID=CAMNT_0049057051 /DNA_START=402 /DNA_END=1267 /DNA_ORIENTATION=-